ncbi:MAG: hypothetical protein WDO73_25265 [Ignavibacteriota bacterium]
MLGWVTPCVSSLTAFSLGAAAGMAWAARKFDCAIRKVPPYRTVTKREMCVSSVGEVVELVALECGHTVRLVSHRRTSWPCDQCQPEVVEVEVARSV